MDFIYVINNIFLESNKKYIFIYIILIDQSEKIIKRENLFSLC